MIRTVSAALFLALSSLVGAQSPAGLYDATVQINGQVIPFRFELSGNGSNLTGAFFNGDEKITSTGGRLENGMLHLNWDQFLAKLEATVKDGSIDGKYIGTIGPRNRGQFDFHATRHTVPSAAAAKNAPSIDGIWEIPTNSGKGEAAWRFVVQQSGADVKAAILRVDGDTGALTGTYRDGKFVLTHFDGQRSSVMEVAPAPDGTLNILQGKNKLTAFRPAEARAKGLPEPTDPNQHTKAKNPKEAFQFHFRDLNGKMVSNTDPQFAGKVVLIVVTGSWCPNCHDEAPFLAEMYRKYRARGLEVVALDFEEEEQLKDPARLRAFVKKYGIEYTVLLCGETSEAKDKLAVQAVNWNSWPTTFFLDRHGLVRAVHAGFPSNGSGKLFVDAKNEFAAQVEKLLSEPRP
jgi:thiol-disulfide isomerase/thioredoxin